MVVPKLSGILPINTSSIQGKNIQIIKLKYQLERKNIHQLYSVRENAECLSYRGTSNPCQHEKYVPHSHINKQLLDRFNKGFWIPKTCKFARSSNSTS